MVLAIDIINDAFSDITVKTNEVDLTTSEITEGVRRLNRLIADFDADGLHLGAHRVTNENEDTFIPPFAEDLFVSTLAIRLAPSFQKPVSPALAAAAERALEIVEKITVINDEMFFPDTLPVGSGNYCNTSYYQRRFFTEGTEPHLTDDHEHALSTDQAVDLEGPQENEDDY